MEKEQKLGIRVFYYYLYNRIIIGTILLIISFVVLSYKAEIISKILSGFNDKAEMVMNYVLLLLFVISGLVLLSRAIISWFEYSNCTYILGENAFSVKRGFFNKREVSIPYRQIQNVSIEHSFSNRAMGVCKLVILTAGNDNNDKDGEAEGVFDVISSDVAEKLKNDLLARSNVQNTVSIGNI